MVFAVAAQSLKMHGRAHATAHDTAGDRVAAFVSSSCDAKLSATMPTHLGHEGKTVEVTRAIEGGENLRFAANFDKFTAA
jgi:hypothetical protein